MKQLCAIYRSPKKEGMYLYVDKTQDLARVPEALLKQFGKPELAMTLLLGPDRKLSQANAAEVINAIDEQGYYLQLPPRPEDLHKQLKPRE
jgi:uncharacterized protein YcgL (UPF0745 family)